MALMPSLIANKENYGRREKRDDLVEVYAAHRSGLSGPWKLPVFGVRF